MLCKLSCIEIQEEEYSFDVHQQAKRQAVEKNDISKCNQSQY